MTIITSLFSLVKYNRGQFKSEKQAAYLLKAFDAGVYVSRQSLTFGEYEGRTNRNTATIEWAFYANAHGITKIEKTTSKGTLVYWEATPEQFAKEDAKAAIRKQERIEEVKGVFEFTMQGINSMLADIDSAQQPAAIKILSQEKVDAIVTSLKVKINQYLSDYQEWAIRAKAKDLF